MESLEQILHDALLAQSGLTALIGQRLYLVQLPQDVLTFSNWPAVVYQRVSTVPLYTHSFDTGQQASVGWARFQITSWSRGPSSGNESDQIARAIHAALQTFNAWADPICPSVVISAPNYLLNRRMHVEPQTDPPLFKQILDVKIWYRDQ